MGDAGLRAGHHRSARSSVGGHADLLRFGMDSPFGRSDSSNNRPVGTAHGRTISSSFDVNLNERSTFMSPPASKSRRTLRQSRSMIIERKAYPLPDPSQFESRASTNAAAPPVSDPINDILYPLQSLRKEREKSQESAQLSKGNNTTNTDKQPFPGSSAHEVENDNNSTSIPSLETLHEEESHLDEVIKEDDEEAAVVEKPAKKVVVVVYDGEKKFSTAPVDIALEGYATAQGDAIVVVAFLEHVMSPLGMKMVADMKQFSGVNETVLKHAVLVKRTEIDTKLRDTNRLGVCQSKEVQLDVKVLPGSNPKALVAKEIIDSQATCVIFDKSAMKNRKYYEENLSCHVLRLRSDGRRVETISLFGQGGLVEKTGSITSHGSDSSSSDSSMNSEQSSTTSIWSRMKLFGSSKRPSGLLRHQHQGSTMSSSSRTSSNLGSPRPLVQEGDDESVPEVVLEESFSFDSPKPNPAEAYAYAAAGLDKLGTYTRSNRGESLKQQQQPTALAA